MGFLDRFFAPTEEVKFISQTLADYREVRKVYSYDYEPEDLRALQACAKDLRPFTWSCVPAGVTWYLSGRLIATKGRPLPFRVVVVVARLMATGQVFRAGYLTGSYRQTRDCMRGLVSLPTPLGGEMAALIRTRNPEHPYLKYERRPPGLEYSDEPRPRIATEENRLAQIAKFKRELAGAKAGQPVPKGEVGEALEGLVLQQHDTLSGVSNARQEYQERRRQALERRGWVAAGGGTAAPAASSGSSSGQGMVITDGPPAAWGSQQVEVPGALPAGITQGATAVEEGQDAGSIGGEDFFGVLGAGAGWGEEGESTEEQRKREGQERRERRRERWGFRRRQPDAGAHPQAADATTLEGSD